MSCLEVCMCEIINYVAMHLIEQDHLVSLNQSIILALSLWKSLQGSWLKIWLKEIICIFADWLMGLNLAHAQSYVLNARWNWFCVHLASLILILILISLYLNPVENSYDPQFRLSYMQISSQCADIIKLGLWPKWSDGIVNDESWVAF